MKETKPPAVICEDVFDLQAVKVCLKTSDLADKRVVHGSFGS
jgi:hypothetical protein